MASEEQKALLLRNLIRLLERANSASNRADDALLLAANTIGRIIRGLPDGLLREQAWKAARPQVLEALTAMSNAVGSEILNEFARMTPEQAKWAADYLNGQPELSYVAPWAEGQAATVRAGAVSSDAPGQAAANRAAFGFNSGLLPRTTELATGLARTFKPSDLWGGGRSPDQLAQMPLRVPDWVYKIVKDTRITGFSVQQFFGESAVLREDLEWGRFVRGQGLGGTTRVQLPDGRNVPRFAKFSYTSIDRHVRTGLLAGLPNEAIAQGIVMDEVRGRMRLGTNAVRLKSDARAAARTMLADMSERLHQAQWAEMSKWEWEEEDGTKHSGDLITGWRWDASMDSRVCESCSIRDGSRAKERKDLPRIPLHVNCRCRVLPTTSITDELEAEDRAAGVVRSGVEFVDNIPKQRPQEPRAAYIKRMKAQGYSVTKTAGPSGERWYRKRVDTKAESVPDWMAELAKRNSPADRLSLQEQLGGNRAGAQRAEYFRRQIEQGVSPQDALVNITRKVSDSDLRTWVPVSTLRMRDPSIGQAEPILSERQKKALARLRARDAASGRSTGSRDPLSRIPAPRRGY